MRSTTNFRQRAAVAYRIGRYEARARLLRRVPRRPAYALARWHGRRYYDRRRPQFEPRARDMAVRLRVSGEQADAWLRRYHELAASDQLDRHLLPTMSARQLGALIDIRGLEHLDRALAAGRGAILCSGHVWGHSTLFAALAFNGYPLSILGFETRQGAGAVVQSVLAHQTVFMARRHGVRPLRVGEFGVGVDAYRSLGENRIVVIEVDHAQGTKRIELDFLGRTSYWPTGHARLAQLSGAPLLHFWLHRHRRWLPQVAVIGPPVHATEGVLATVRQCAEQIERSVVADPPSWSPWLYSRRFLWEPDDGSAGATALAGRCPERAPAPYPGAGVPPARAIDQLARPRRLP